MSSQRIGVYICHCGGNISDYVDVEKVRSAVENEPGVIVAKTVMFACSDAAQGEMIEDVKGENLDGLVVASCSPRLHLFTFRGTARRAGLNPYQYIQVNLREQDSWAHTDDKSGATEKAIRMLRAGIAKTRHSVPLEPQRIDTAPRVLVIGAGISGLRAALALSDLGLTVFVVEREKKVGGWVAELGEMYPNNRKGVELIQSLMEKVSECDNIQVYTDAEVVEKQGCVGNFDVKVRVSDGNVVSLNVGSIIVATGFETYTPAEGEFGYGLKGVVTLPEFRKWLDTSGGTEYDGKRINSIAYVYCVGSRQSPEVDNAHEYCSRYCCTAAVHTSVVVSEKFPSVVQYHLYRDMRTYGKYERLYEDSRNYGAVFLRYSESEPPVVEESGGKLVVRVKDVLTEGEEIGIAVDMVVLVTGMVPRSNDALINIFKLPVGRDGFFNEIHPKLRPVETISNGVFICGACQGPKNSVESVASSLAAVAKSAAPLKRGYVELEPLIATVNSDACEWCGECEKACPYSAVDKVNRDGRDVAVINAALCKGCGACVPVCEKDAIDVLGYSDGQILDMIDALLVEVPA